MMRRWAWLVSTCLLILSLTGLSQLQFQTKLDPKSYLSPKEQTQAGSIFQSQEHLLLLAQFEKPPSKGSLSQLTKKFLAVPGISNVIGADHLPGNRDNFFHPTENEALFILEHGGQNNTSLLENQRRIQRLNEGITAITKEIPFRFQIAGRSHSRQALHEQLESEILFPVTAIAIAILTLPLLLYKSWIFLAVPTVLGLWVLLLTFGLYGFAGSHFGYFSLTLIPLILCLCLLDCLFLLDRFSQLSGKEPHPLQSAIKDILPPALITTVTTSIGFLALYLISDTPVIGEYAIFAFAGVWIAFISTFFLLPTLLPKKLTVSLTPPAKYLDVFCNRVLFLSRTHRKPLLISCVACLLFTVPFVPSPRPTSPRLLSTSHPYQQTIEKLSSHLGTLLPVQFTIKTKTDRTSNNTRHLLYAHAFERWLHAEKLIKHTLSPFQVIEPQKTFRKSFTKPDWHKLAKKSHGFLEVEGMDRITSISFLAWLTDDAPSSYNRLQHYLKNYERTMMAEFTYEMTGPYILNKVIESRFIREAGLSFCVVLGVILLLSFFIIRDVLLWLSFLCVNLGPLVLLTGLTGLLKVPFHLGIIGLPAILLGIIVDDSIHIIWQFRKEGNEQASVRKVGRAVIVSSLLLFIGIGGQIFSGYGANVDFGIIGGMGIVIALIFDILVLPALLSLVREHRLKAMKLQRCRSPQQARPSQQSHLPAPHSV